MSFLSRFQTIEHEDKQRAVHVLVQRATPDFDFFFMITLSVLMATFGLLAGSEAIIIGSMLIAPILYPVLGIALSLSMSDQALLRQSLWTVAKAIGISFVAATASALLFISVHGGTIHETPIIAARTSPSLLLLLVGVVAGVAVVYALVKPKLSETLPGVAISVALIPPLATAGIGFAGLNLAITLGAFATFFVNVFGIIGAGMITFSLMNVYSLRSVAHKTMEKEAVRVEEENKKAQAVDDNISLKDIHTD
ncbi:MAG TPA: DUF389 domain-containing protein [Candidatus Kaiserbacteria bacterium]|nr:DUF389 domain-containing protein [Candidatus Kaiserbacteria bacterium]